MLQGHLVYFLPQPWNQLFLQGALLLLLVNDDRNQYLYAKYIQCYWNIMGIGSNVAQEKTRGNEADMH